MVMRTKVNNQQYFYPCVISLKRDFTTHKGICPVLGEPICICFHQYLQSSPTDSPHLNYDRNMSIYSILCNLSIVATIDQGNVASQLESVNQTSNKAQYVKPIKELGTKFYCLQIKQYSCPVVVSFSCSEMRCFMTTVGISTSMQEGFEF